MFISVQYMHICMDANSNDIFRCRLETDVHITPPTTNCYWSPLLTQLPIFYKVATWRLEWDLNLRTRHRTATILNGCYINLWLIMFVWTLVAFNGNRSVEDHLQEIPGYEYPGDQPVKHSPQVVTLVMSHLNPMGILKCSYICATDAYLYGCKFKWYI